jgi:hypothetical protein
MSDAMWALTNVAVAAVSILAIAGNCYRIHRAFERDERKARDGRSVHR